MTSLVIDLNAALSAESFLARASPSSSTCSWAGSSHTANDVRNRSRRRCSTTHAFGEHAWRNHLELLLQIPKILFAKGAGLKIKNRGGFFIERRKEGEPLRWTYGSRLVVGCSTRVER